MKIIGLFLLALTVSTVAQSGRRIDVFDFAMYLKDNILEGKIYEGEDAISRRDFFQSIFHRNESLEKYITGLMNFDTRARYAELSPEEFKIGIYLFHHIFLGSKDLDPWEVAYLSVEVSRAYVRFKFTRQDTFKLFRDYMTQIEPYLLPFDLRWSFGLKITQYPRSDPYTFLEGAYSAYLESEDLGSVPSIYSIYRILQGLNHLGER